MNRTLAISVAAAAAIAMSPFAASAAQPQSARQCFYSRDITNFRTVGDHRVNLEVNHRQLYSLDLLNPCPELTRHRDVIALEQTPGGGPICTGLEADIIVPGQGLNRCPVKTIKRLTTAEIAALPKKERP